VTESVRLTDPIFTSAEIAEAVARVSAEIAEDCGGEPLLFVVVLKGALIFAADLLRALPASIDVEIDFLAVSSYGSGTTSGGDVRLLKDTSDSVEGKNVVIVEDIVDNGWTLSSLQATLAARGPASLRTCVLLDKPYRRRSPVTVDYRGFVAPDSFMVGYGLDYNERFRHLPFLAGAIVTSALDRGIRA
jgi:hypoxanthine phosphoribosyltransferase